MKNVVLKKEIKKNGKKVYTAIENDEVIFKSSPTHRDYVAMFLSRGKGRNGQMRVFCDYRFGRMDLVGKSDSKRMYERNSKEDYFAVLN